MTRRFSRFALVALLTLGLLAPSGVLAAPPPAVRAHPAASGQSGEVEYQPDHLLIGFRTGIDDSRKNQKAAGHRATLAQRLSSINVDLVRLPPGTDVLQAARELAQDPEVAFAEPNFKAHAQNLAVPSDSLYLAQYGPQKLRALDAHNVAYPGGYPAYAGGNPTSLSHPLIAVVDTGVAASSTDSYASLDLVRKLFGVAADCTRSSPFVTEPCPISPLYDDNGHGTHVAGIAAAETNNGMGVMGIAPGAEVVSIKVLDSTGSGYESWIAAGILCAADLATCGLGAGRADVINLSLGAAVPLSAVAAAVQTAQNTGVVVVAAAGNNNTTAPLYPAGYADLSVIATDSSDLRASFSNYGGYGNQVSAPGASILSTVSRDPALGTRSDPSGYKRLSGTSMAAPHVSGLAALLSGLGQTRATIIGQIKRSVDPLPGAGAPNYTSFGYGRVNAFKAVRSLYSYATVTTLPPGSVYNTPLSATLASPPPADFAISWPTSVPVATVSSPQGGSFALVTVAAGGFAAASGAFEYSALDAAGARTTALSLSSSAGAVPGTWGIVVGSSSPVGNYTVTIWVNVSGLAHAVTFSLAITGAAPLVLSAVQASNIDATSAVITWQTDAPANSRVDYGPTSAYGSAVSNPAVVTNHSVTLSGLANGTTYHFKATSTDPAGRTGGNTDATFTTYPNLIANGGFELGSASWGLAPQAMIDPSPANAHLGNNSLRLLATAPWQASWQVVPVTPGQAYSFSAWGRSTSSGGEYLLWGLDGAGSIVTFSELPFAGTGAWVPVASTFVAAANVVWMAVIPISSTPGTFWFDDIALSPTTNLIANGGFELGSAGWGLAAQATVDPTPANAHTGTNSLKLMATAPWQASWQVVPVTPGQTYTFSGWGRSTSSGGEYVLFGLDAAGSVVTFGELPFAGTGAWVPVTAPFIAAANVVSVAVIPVSLGPGTFWFDDIALTRP